MNKKLWYFLGDLSYPLSPLLRCMVLRMLSLNSQDEKSIFLSNMIH